MSPDRLQRVPKDTKGGRLSFVSATSSRAEMELEGSAPKAALVMAPKNPGYTAKSLSLYARNRVLHMDLMDDLWTRAFCHFVGILTPKID